MAYTRRFVGAGGGGGAGSGTVTNTGNLTANHLVIGNGGVDESVLASLGTTTTVLHGNAGGAPSFAAVDLANDVGTSLVGAANGGVARFTAAQQDYWLLPYGNAVQMNANVSSAAFTANHTRALLVQVYGIVTFTKMTINVVTSANTQKYYIGLYSKDKTTLIRQAIYSLTASTGLYAATVASTTLTPGSYWFTWGCDSVTPIITAMTAAAGGWATLFAAAAGPYLGDSDGLIAAGSLPAAVGTITAASLAVPLVLLEP